MVYFNLLEMNVSRKMCYIVSVAIIDSRSYICLVVLVDFLQKRSIDNVLTSLTCVPGHIYEV